MTAFKTNVLVLLLKDNFHKEVFEYCFLYCKGFAGDCNDHLQNWSSGIKLMHYIYLKVATTEHIQSILEEKFEFMVSEVTKNQYVVSLDI